MASRALILCGGPWQVPIIRYLREHGCDVTVVDPAKPCAGGDAANRQVYIDARDTAAILKQFKKGDFDIVTSDQTDISIHAVSEVATALDVAANSPAAVDRFTDKSECRKL